MKQQTTRRNRIDTCIECNELREVKARGICSRCYSRLAKNGTLSQYPTCTTLRVAERQKRAVGPKSGPLRAASRESGIPSVQAIYAYDDANPHAPTGQKIAVYRCPFAKDHGRTPGLAATDRVEPTGVHQVSWLPVDADPGLKESLCRQKSASGRAPGRLVTVLAPPPERVFSEKPSVAEVALLERSTASASHEVKVA